MSVANIQDRARDIVDNLVANGAELHFNRAVDCRPAGFHYELHADGDRQRCRRLIASAKGDPHLWSALVVEIGIRCRGAA